MQIMEWVLFFLIITGGFTLSGLVGFGANVLSMPILSFFFDLSDLVVVFAAISFTNAAYRVVENRKGILRKDFLQMMGVTLPGTLLGWWGLHTLPKLWMKFALGCFVVAVAGRSLYQKQQNTETCAAETEQKMENREAGENAETKKERSDFNEPNVGKTKKRESKRRMVLYRMVLFWGGVMQGAFVCGGPLYLVYCNHYYGRRRRTFRGMQFAVIFVNSSFLFFSYLLGGAYTRPLLLQSGLGLLGLCFAIRISNAWLKQWSDAALQRLIQMLLFLSGSSLILQTFAQWVS